MRILLAGGGTGGPVSPMIAVAKKLKDSDPNATFLFVGTKSGPESKLIKEAGFEFISIPAARWRRYFSLKNIVAFPLFMWSLVKANRVLKQFQPDLVFSVGGFVAVPIVWMAKTKGIKIVIHQQDAMPGLANKLCSPFADAITCALEETAKRFHSDLGLYKQSKTKQIEWVGNPVREEFFTNDLPYRDFFKLHDQLPILLVTGGGTGAEQINTVVAHALPELVKSHQVVHVTGSGKAITGFNDPNYHQYEFLGKEFPTIMKMAHMVVSRCGLSTLAELSALAKLTIAVPIPDSHQEFNAEVLRDRVAAVVLSKDEFDPENLIRVVNSLKFNVARQQMLTRNMAALMPRDATEKLAAIIKQQLNGKS